MKERQFDVMNACEASAKDFVETLMFCLEEDEIISDKDSKKEWKEYLDSVLEMHYNTDIGEQGENITGYLEECGYYDGIEENMTLLFEVEKEISKWLKDNSYTNDESVGGGFEPIEGYQGRSIDYEYNGNIEDLDVEDLSYKLSLVIDNRFSVKVSTYKDDDLNEAYKNLFCVEVVIND